MNVQLKNGKTVQIRAAKATDAEAILTCMNQIVRETKNLAREPEEWRMNVEEEIVFLSRMEDSPHEYMAIALDGENVIATAGIHGKPLQRLQHRVTLGISILKAYHRQGLGRILMNHLLEQAKQMGKRTVDLEVRADNLGAIALYEEVGFVIEGRKKEGFYVDGSYVDELLMACYLEDKQ